LSEDSLTKPLFYDIVLLIKIFEILRTGVGQMTNSERQSYLTTPLQQTARALFAMLVWSLALAVIPLCIAVLGPLWGFTVGTSAWILMLTHTLHYFVVSVPEVTGLITINLLLRPTELDRYANQHVYQTGLSFRFPWEQVKLGLYINLRIVTQTFEEDFSAKGSPATEKKQQKEAGAEQKKKRRPGGKAGAGPKVTIRGSIQYRAFLQLLPRYVAVDESTINRGLVDIIESYLSDTVATDPPEKARTNVKKYQKGITDLFQDEKQLLNTAYEVKMAQQQKDKDKKISFEWLYAIDLLLVQVADIEYEPRYQEVLSAQERGKRLAEIADEWQARGLEPKDATNAALIINGDVPKEIVEVEGNAWQALQGIVLGAGSLNLGEQSRKSRRPKRPTQ
jgi:hypothetical protein